MGILTDTADKLVNNRISFHDAGLIAERTVFKYEYEGSFMFTEDQSGRGIVLEKIDAELGEWATDIQPLPREDLRKWAAIFLMAKAQLAYGYYFSVLDNLQHALDACGGSFPPNASRFIMATIDALLREKSITRTWKIAPEQKQWLKYVRRTCLKSWVLSLLSFFRC